MPRPGVNDYIWHLTVKISEWKQLSFAHTGEVSLIFDGSYGNLNLTPLAAY